MLKNKKMAIIATIIAMLLWGSAIPTIKTTYQELGVGRSDIGAQIFFAGIRFFLAGVLAFIYLKVFNKEKVIRENVDKKYIVILAIIQTFAQYVFYYIALSNTSGVKAAIIQSTNAFMIVLISLIILPSERVHSNTIFAISLGTIGIVVVNGGIREIGSEFNPMGDGMVLLSTFFNSLSSVYIRKYGKDQNEFLVTASQFILGSLPLIIIGYIMNKNNLIFTTKAVGLLLYGAFISATAYVIWNSVLKYHSANEMGMYKLFIPIFGSILSVIILGEDFTINLLLGLILVILGSVILNINKKKFNGN
jgi:protein of hypothetical function DUF6 transmembrane